MRDQLGRLIVLATLSLAAAGAASAQDRRYSCSEVDLKGAWGYTETGTVVAPSPSGPVSILAVAVGTYRFDFQGNFQGTQKSSAGGTINEDAKVGTYSLDSDCTGTLTLQIFDSTGTTLRRNSVWQFVLVDNATELRGIMTKMTLPNGVSLSPIMTVTARKLFPRE